MSEERSKPIFLTEGEVRKALPMTDAVEAMRVAFSALSTGGATVPIRESIALDEFSGSSLFMPAYLPDIGAYSIKIASIHAGNRMKGLDAVQAVVLLFDAETGSLDAILEGRSVTAIRTGAGSGLATELLARDDARAVAIFGSGVQARSHLEAMCAVRQIERAYIIGRTPSRVEAFVSEMADRLNIDVVGDDGSRIGEADIVCTTTTATDPILALGDIGPGVHINAVGTHRPADTEIDFELVKASKLVVDQRQACLKEAGEIAGAIRAGVIDQSHIFAEVGELAAGLKPGREAADEITLFKSVGNAIQDLTAAVTAVKNARRLGLGSKLEL